MARTQDADSNGGFNIIALAEPFQARTFHARIEAARNEQIERLGTGYCQNWDDYQRKRGFIEGLKMALQICEDIASEKERR